MTATTTLLNRLRQAVPLLAEESLGDGQLLTAFVAEQSEAAFAALVRRHGGMVLGVCQRVLGHTQDAEDAFQASFLVLARRAAAIRPRERVGAWLHGVAQRTALKARTARTRRQVREQRVMTRSTVVDQEPVDTELRAVLDEALRQLPEVYRQAIVSCDLEGHSRKDAARRLGWREGTLSGRLARGRRLLAQRLQSRGVTLSVAALAGVLSQQMASAAPPTKLSQVTIKAAIGFAAGNGTTAGLVPARVVALAEEVMSAMLLQKLKSLTILCLLALTGFGLVAGLLPAQAAPDEPSQPEPLLAVAPAEAPAGPGRIYYHHGLALHTVNPDGSDVQTLPAMAAQDMPNYQSNSARLSPDGKRLAFGLADLRQGGAHPPSRILLRNLADSQPAEAVVSIPNTEMYQWLWSPDGKQLAYQTWDGQDGTFGYRNWIVDLGTKESREVKTPRYQYEGKDYYSIIQGWSPDGKWLLTYGGGFHLVRPDGSEARKVSDTQQIWGARCRFAPDGKRILFVRHNDNKSDSVHILNLATGKESTVVQGLNFMDITACWSPDGKRIAFSMTLRENDNRGTETSLNVIDTDGQNAMTVITDKHQPNQVTLVLTDWR